MCPQGPPDAPFVPSYDLCPSGLFHIPWTWIARAPHHPSPLRSSSHLTPSNKIHLNCHFHIPQHLSGLTCLPLPSPREPEPGCLLALWTGGPCTTGQPLYLTDFPRLPGTYHDIHATLSTYTGQALMCGQLASGFLSSCHHSLCTHRNTCTSP